MSSLLQKAVVTCSRRLGNRQLLSDTGTRVTMLAIERRKSCAGSHTEILLSAKPDPTYIHTYTQLDGSLKGPTDS
jgi:hypothetical protein